MLSNGRLLNVSYCHLGCGGVYVCVFVSDSLSDALKAITVSTELIEEELKPHLDTLLAALLEKSKSCNTHTHTHIHVFSLVCHPCSSNSINYLTQLSSNIPVTEISS